MEKKLKKLFEYQLFAENPRLAKLISETESRYGEALDEEALEQVAAAGDLLEEKTETGTSAQKSAP